jgi:hypothetical protein
MQSMDAFLPFHFFSPSFHKEVERVIHRVLTTCASNRVPCKRLQCDADIHIKLCCFSLSTFG